MYWPRAAGDTFHGEVDLLPVGEERLQYRSPIGRQPVEALVAILLLAPFADEQPLIFEPSQQWIEGAFLDVQAAVRQRLLQRVSVVLDSQLGEHGHHEATAAELLPKRFERRDRHQTSAPHTVRHTVLDVKSRPPWVP